MPLTGKAKTAYALLDKAIKRQGLLLADAVQELSEDMAGEVGWSEAIELAKAEFEKRLSEIELGRKPTSFHKKNRLKWYPGPNEEKDKFWPLLKKFLLEKKSWDDDTVKSIDDASTKVVFNLDFPGQPTFTTKGLVLGYVQSGKTANFTAVMSKAADAGFRLFIVLSGMTNSLRQQTQQRLDEELVALQSPTAWLTWTTQDSDIGDLPFNIATFLDIDKRHLAVVKKNGPRMRRLLRMIRGAGPILGRIPVMIIDDECDQASVNASSVRGRRTAINKLLNDLIEVLPKVSYVGYTATPYANVLIDPSSDDIYPSDFIISLIQPPSYFGAEKLFGRDLLDADPVAPDADGMDMIRLVGDDEASRLRPASRLAKDTFELEVTETLRKAIFYYWLATAAREVRGDAGQHSTMLIHTTVYAQSHVNAIRQIDDFRRITLAQLQNGQASLLTELRTLWNDESLRVPAAEFGRDQVHFDVLLNLLERVVLDTEILAENSISDVRLDYSDPGRRYIVVGGNVLARGLTIEGLVSSFFLRTSSQYDSLMQMGRWFGYRPGYEDLPRIYTTADMAEYFKDMATVEAELRYDIETYERENLTPKEFAVRIRRHPALAITARNKMLAAVERQVSFNGRHIQTRKFHHLSSDWLQSNWEAGARLLNSIRECQASSRSNGRPLFLNVPCTLIIRFLRDYNVHEAHEDMARDRLCEYIARQVQRPENDLARWNVGVMTGEGKRSELELGPVGRIATVRRSQLEYSSDPDSADIKALAGLTDATLDFSENYSAQGKKWRDLAIDRRQQFEDSRPLLLLYPIERVSQPQKTAPSGKRSVRRALNAVVDVLGMAIFFPKLDVDEPVGYVSAPIDTSQYEDAEYIEEIIDD